MVRLRDLSAIDRETLLREARQQIEQENIEKDAVVMYNLKKKELVTNTLKELERLLGFKYGADQKRLKDHIISLANYLYKVRRNYKNMSAGVSIINEEEWNNYVLVLNNIKTMIIMSYKGESLNEPEDKV